MVNIQSLASGEQTSVIHSDETELKGSTANSTSPINTLWGYPAKSDNIPAELGEQRFQMCLFITLQSLWSIKKKYYQRKTDRIKCT